MVSVVGLIGDVSYGFSDGLNEQSKGSMNLLVSFHLARHLLIKIMQHREARSSRP